MARELMWACVIVPDDFRKTVVQLCLEQNKEIGLPENVFKLPLHISMKKSFYTNFFDSVKDYILKAINGIGRFRCQIDKLSLRQGMLWLSLVNRRNLRYLQENLDLLLAVKYNVPISKYDRVFQPHISLFIPQEQMRAMYDRLKEMDFGNEIEISRFVIGASGHKDTFYDLK